MKIHFIAIGGATMYSLAINGKRWMGQMKRRSDIIRFGTVTFKRAK